MDCLVYRLERMIGNLTLIPSPEGEGGQTVVHDFTFVLTHELLNKVQSVEECDATGDAMKNFCWVHKK